MRRVTNYNNKTSIDIENEDNPLHNVITEPTYPLTKTEDNLKVNLSFAKSMITVRPIPC